MSSAHPAGLRRPSAIRGARYQAAGRGPHLARRGGGNMGSVCNAERSTPRSPNQSCDADGYAKARRHQLPARALHAALVSAFAGEFRHRREARRRDCASKVGSDRRLRWNLRQLYEALDARRRDQQLSWNELARILSCTDNHLTGLRTARFATNIVLAMRIVQWLGRPATDFIYPSTW